jgi:hypothetical protein
MQDNNWDGTIEGKWDDVTDDALDEAADSSRDRGAEVEGAVDEWDCNTVNEKPVSFV